MADQVADPSHVHGDMPVAEQSATFVGFMGLVRWGGLAVADLVFFLVLWFCVPTGFFPALALAVIVGVVGVVMLGRRKPSSTDAPR